MSGLHPVEIWYKLVEFCRKYNSFTTACQFITQFKGHLNFAFLVIIKPLFNGF